MLGLKLGISQEWLDTREFQGTPVHRSDIHLQFAGEREICQICEQQIPPHAAVWVWNDEQARRCTVCWLATGGGVILDDRP